MKAKKIREGEYDDKEKMAVCRSDYGIVPYDSGLDNTSICFFGTKTTNHEI